MCLRCFIPFCAFLSIKLSCGLEVTGKFQISMFVLRSPTSPLACWTFCAPSSKCIPCDWHKSCCWFLWGATGTVLGWASPSAGKMHMKTKGHLLVWDYLLRWIFLWGQLGICNVAGVSCLFLITLFINYVLFLIKETGLTNTTILYGREDSVSMKSVC